MGPHSVICLPELPHRFLQFLDTFLARRYAFQRCAKLKYSVLNKYPYAAIFRDLLSCRWDYSRLRTSPDRYPYDPRSDYPIRFPRNESFKNLGNIGLFATRPPSRSRSRSGSSGGAVGSGSFPLKSFSTLDSKSGFEEVSMKIRGAMKERGQIRRRQSDFAREEEEANDSENERKDE